MDIDEGVLADDFTGRKWVVSVKTGAEAREEKRDQKVSAKTDGRRHQDVADQEAVCSALDKLVKDRAVKMVKDGYIRLADGAVQYGVVEAHARISKDRFSAAFNRLTAAGTLERVTDMTVPTGNGGTRRNGVGMRRAPNGEQTDPWT